MSKENFEEALLKLQTMSEKIRAQDTNLEDSIKCYEEGIKYYKICDDILNKANQKIETFERNE